MKRMVIMMIRRRMKRSNFIGNFYCKRKEKIGRDFYFDKYRKKYRNEWRGWIKILKKEKYR